MFSHNTKKKLLPYLDGELNQAERSLVEKHLAVCPRCRRELESLRSLTSALRCSAPEVEAEPVDLWSRVESQITTVPARRANRLSGSRLQMAGVFAAVLLIAVVGFGMFGQFARMDKFRSAQSPQALSPGSLPMPPGMAPRAMPGGMGPGGPGMPGMGAPPGGMPIGPGAPQPEKYRALPTPGRPGSVPQENSAGVPPKQERIAKDTRPWSGTPSPTMGYAGEGGDPAMPPAAEVMAENVDPKAKSELTRGGPLTNSGGAPLPGAPGMPGGPASPGAAPPGPSIGEPAPKNSTGEAHLGATHSDAILKDSGDAKASAGKLDKPAATTPAKARSAPAATVTTLDMSSITEKQIEDMPASQWRVLAQQARRQGKTAELAGKFEASFKRTNRADLGLFLLDIRMNPLDKAGLVRTADALSALGSTSQDFWLRVGQGYEIAGKLNAAEVAYGRALDGSDGNAAASARARLDRLRSKK